MKQVALNFLPLISSILIRIYALILCLFRWLGWIKIKPSSALLLPPSAPGSVGDEAMVVAAVDHLKSQGIDRIELVSYNIKMEYPVSEIGSFDMRDYFIYTSGFKFLQKALQFGCFVSQFEKFYFLGADLMDGYYSDYVTFKRVKLVEMAARMGVKSTILGFSFNKQPTKIAIESIKNLPDTVQLCTRDAVSQERLEKSIERSVKLVADVAFLLQPAQESDKVLSIDEWIDKQKKEERFIIGINCNNQLVEKIKNQTAKTLVKAYIERLSSLFNARQNLSFLLIPHDFRSIKGNSSDDTLAKLILEGLPAEMQSYCKKIPTPCRAAEIKAMVANVDLVVSGRMHLAIATLGQGVPVFCITYQGKFEGLFQHFGLKNMTLEPTDLLDSDPSVFVNYLVSSIENKNALDQQIQEKLPKVKELAKSNFM
jgi:polysaccharide pyruvyl transferase WcaK-like protein